MSRVLIVNETRLMCRVLGALLRDEEDFHVAGLATDAEEALETLKDVEIVLVEDASADGGPVKITDEIKKRDPSINILITGVEKEPNKILNYIKGGSGYVLAEVEQEIHPQFFGKIGGWK